MNGNNSFNSDKGSFISGNLLSKIHTGKAGTYVLNSSSVSGNQAKFAVALSNHVVKVYDVNGKLLDEYVHDRKITDIKFCSSDPMCLFTSSVDGKLNVWDSRCQGPVQTFIDDSDGVLKPLLCFDYNLDKHLLCAGTEVFREDAFLLFWDRRTSEILGGYWNCHTDDITQINFHPSITTCMASSSVDGLINVFDLLEKTEADAITYTLNVESAVNKFCWKTDVFISCTTSIEEYQIWDMTDASPAFQKSREELSTKEVKVDCMIDNLKVKDHCYLVTGTHEGKVNLWNANKCELQSYGLKYDLRPYIVLKGHTDVVRTICYNIQNDILLTGGEDGCICLWKVSH